MPLNIYTRRFIHTRAGKNMDISILSPHLEFVELVLHLYH